MGKYQTWSEEELEILYNNRNLTFDKLHELLPHRTRRAIEICHNQYIGRGRDDEKNKYQMPKEYNSQLLMWSK